MSFPAIILRKSLGLYLSAKSDGTIILDKAPYIWSTTATLGAGQDIYSILSNNNSKYLAGDPSLLIKAGSCPLALMSTGTLLWFGGIAINGHIPIYAVNLNASLTVFSNQPIFDTAGDSEGWVVQTSSL